MVNVKCFRYDPVMDPQEVRDGTGIAASNHDNNAPESNQLAMANGIQVIPEINQLAMANNQLALANGNQAANTSSVFNQFPVLSGNGETNMSVSSQSPEDDGNGVANTSE